MALTTIDIDRYLEFTSVVDRLPKRDFWFAYDSEADVAYINFYSPPKAATDSELTEDDIVVRYDGGEIIGITILDASQR